MLHTIRKSLYIIICAYLLLESLDLFYLVYELLSQSRKLTNRGVLIIARGGGVENFLKKISEGTLIRDSRVG